LIEGLFWALRSFLLDFMRDAMYDGRPFQTLNVIDEGNREVQDGNLSAQCAAEFARVDLG
jgi:hypothetical protein